MWTRYEYEFDALASQWQGPDPFQYVAVPADVTAEVRTVAAGITSRWGMIPATVRIGASAWTTSLWPRDGGYVIPLNETVRRSEAIDVGEAVTVEIVVRVPEPHDDDGGDTLHAPADIDTDDDEFFEDDDEFEDDDAGDEADDDTATLEIDEPHDELDEEPDDEMSDAAAGSSSDGGAHTVGAGGQAAATTTRSRRPRSAVAIAAATAIVRDEPRDVAEHNDDQPGANALHTTEHTLVSDIGEPGADHADELDDEQAGATMAVTRSPALAATAVLDTRVERDQHAAAGVASGTTITALFHDEPDNTVDESLGEADVVSRSAAIDEFDDDYTPVRHTIVATDVAAIDELDDDYTPVDETIAITRTAAIDEFIEGFDDDENDDDDDDRADAPVDSTPNAVTPDVADAGQLEHEATPVAAADKADDDDDDEYEYVYVDDDEEDGDYEYEYVYVYVDEDGNEYEVADDE